MKRQIEKADMLEPLKIDLSDIFINKDEVTIDFPQDPTNDHKVIYLDDYERLVLEKFQEAMYEIQMYQGVCGCYPSNDNEDNCKCYKTKLDMDKGERGRYMYGGMIGAEIACEALTKITEEIIESTHERSFCCECDLTEAKKEAAKAREFFKSRRKTTPFDVREFWKRMKEVY